MRSRKRLICGAFTLALFGLFLTGCTEEFSNEKKQLEGMEITTPAFSQLQDGTYIGAFRAGSLLAAETEVTMAAGRIERIVVLEHQTGLGKKAETIIDEVVKKQSLNVEAVSGATYSSKVILKAVETALLHEASD